jgi:hypothetical protein
MNPSATLRSKRLPFIATAVILLALAALPPGARALERQSARLADVEPGPQEVRFRPLVDGGSWEVVLSGPSEIWLRWRLDNGDPAISLADLEQRAGGLPDGLYSWELIRTEGTVTAGVIAAPQQVQAGYFSILQGSIVQPVDEATRAPQPRQTIAEDLWVVGRMCVGDDCSDAQTMPFETIRLDQNNAQIRFRDTSPTMGTFPTRDWRIQANDTSSGGGEYFAIVDEGDTGSLTIVPFRIEAGAPANTLYLEDDGDVGIGTSNPATELHVIGDATIDGDLAVLSSRDAKQHLVPARGDEILARLDELPLFTWRYRGEAHDVLHLGPTAEGFSRAFGLGADERHLSPSDMAGVALAAVRELSLRLRHQQEQLAGLQRQNGELTRRLQDAQIRHDGTPLASGTEPAALLH